MELFRSTNLHFHCQLRFLGATNLQLDIGWGGVTSLLVNAVQEYWIISKNYQSIFFSKNLFLQKKCEIVAHLQKNKCLTIEKYILR